MKKRIAILLIAALTLTGCSAKSEISTETTAVKAEVAIQETTVPEETETIPAEVTQPVTEVPETEPAAPPIDEEEPQPTVTEEAPKQPESVQNQEAAKPVQPPVTTQESPKPQTTPVSTTPGRKVSSATCKDTGSNQIWEEPDIRWYDPFETDDMERLGYIDFLGTYGDPNAFYLQSYDITMRVGRHYAIPLLTDAETFKSCAWVSSDPTVATVNSVGVVTPLKTGTTTITIISTISPVYTICTCYVQEVEEQVFQYTYAQLEQMAKEEAKKIAAYASEHGTTDLEKIGIAASIIHSYIEENHGGSYYGIAGGDLVSIMVPGYNQPFGTLVTFYSTCAGDTRALGLVLEYMGFQWYHEGENQWDHQWCVVYDVDGQTAFADVSFLGIVGYGDRTEDQSNWQYFETSYPVPKQ